MSTYNFLQQVSVAGIRDYLITHRVDQGDTLVLHPQDYDNIFHEAQNSEVPLDLPLNLFGVLLSKDNSDSVPAGKVQIVKNEATSQ